MARPHKPIQRRSNGNYFVRLVIDGKRLTRSLETKDPRVAAKRAAQALEELEMEAAGPQQPRWRGDEVGIEWDIPSKADGSNDYENAKPREIQASQIANPEDLRGIRWRDLVAEAVAVRKRKKNGQDYSDAWYENVRIALDKIPFEFEEATPQAIRSWVLSMQKEGLGGRTIEINCSYFRSLTNTCIRSGMLDGQTNPWSMVDFSSDPEEQKHIYTATEADYRGLKELLSGLENYHRIPILLQVFLGTRISELQRRKPEDFDLDARTMSVVRDDEKGQRVKNRHSIRTVPLPEWLCEEMKSWDYKVPASGETLNKRLRTVNPELTSHSFRHGLIRLNRDLGGEPMVIEAATGHKIKTGGSDMSSIYGDGFSVDSMRRALEPIWNQIEEWIKRGRESVFNAPMGGVVGGHKPTSYQDLV